MEFPELNFDNAVKLPLLEQTFTQNQLLPHHFPGLENKTGSMIFLETVSGTYPNAIEEGDLEIASQRVSGTLEEISFPQIHASRYAYSEALLRIGSIEQLLINSIYYVVDYIQLEFYLTLDNEKVERTQDTDLSANNPSQFIVEPVLGISEKTNPSNVFLIPFKLSY
jgi:hypothetical protein